MDPRDPLFSTINAIDLQQHQRQQMASAIAGIHGDQLLRSNAEDLVSYFVETYRIDVPTLDEAGMTVDQHESTRDISGDPMRMAYSFRSGPTCVAGTEVIVEVPFTGAPEMFAVQPSTYDFNPPRGDVQGNTLVFRSWSDAPHPEKLRAELQKWIEDVQRYLQWLDGTFQGFNGALANEARTAVQQRRQKLLSAQMLVENLGIQLKRRDAEAATYTAPEVRRKIIPRMPPASAGPFRPEPTLDEAEYQHILDVLGRMVKVMERSPMAFHAIDEEALRTHFLMQLNGHYEGQATGETFNYEGKSDILIRSGDRNVFVAECKFWSGPAKLTATIDQLLGYLAWRDSKAAILLFNRNKNFSKVLSAIPNVVKAHANFVRDEGPKGETAFRYAFRHKDDPAKSLHITVMAFDVPSPANLDMSAT